MKIDQNTLKSLLHYNTETGIFTWLVSGGKAKIGKIAGSVRADGSVGISISGKTHRAHRLAWLYMTGSFPDKFIDHRNRTPTDNRWLNLRLATPLQNSANCKLASHNTSGKKGVSKHRRKGWNAAIQVSGKSIYLGTYSTTEEAGKAYDAAAIKYFGEFAAPNNIISP